MKKIKKNRTRTSGTDSRSSQMHTIKWNVKVTHSNI